MSSRSRSPERVSFANINEALPLPDLIAIQRDSFQWFLDKGLAEAYHDISPIEDFTGQLSLELEFDPTDADLRPPPKFSVEECKEKDMTYAAPVFVRARFLNATTGEIKEQTVFMGDFPMMTDRGTFIVNGTERVVVSQLVRSPGVIFQPGRDAKTVFTGTIHPYRGEWIELDIEAKPGKDVTAGCRVARKRRLSLFVLLRALGYGDEAFLDRFVRHFDFLEGQWEKERNLAPTREEALLEIYKRARPGEPLSAEAARVYFENAFFNPKRYDLTRVGRYKLNRKLGPEIDRLSDLFGIDIEKPAPNQSVLSPSEILASATYMLHLALHMADGESTYRIDDQDHFANRRIRSVGELIQNQVRVGLSRMERVVRERMTTQDVEAITPQTLINIRPVVAAVKEFFGTSQLSQFMDQNNPLSGLAHKRRLSALGPGGLSRERAGFEVRDVHTSHYGRMCPIETPEGPNIGLIGALATYARVNEYGFIETPYRTVVDGKVTDEVSYLAADEEEEHVIAQANAVGRRRRPPHRGARPGAPRPARHRRAHGRRRRLLRDDVGDRLRAAVGGRPHGRVAEADRLGLDGAHPLRRARRRQPGAHGRQHAEAGRAARRPRGALHRHRGRGPRRPRRRRRAAGRGQRAPSPRSAATPSRSSTPRARRTASAPRSGRKVYRLSKFRRSNQNTCINHRTLVTEGQSVAAGDLLADGPSTHNGELALGKNLLVAFMPWEGYNYEDAIILSERLVRDDVLTSIHIEEHEVDARDTKLGAEEITRDIPNLSEEILADLDDRGIIRVGAEVEPGDVLVGKVTPKGETEQTPEERLLRAIFGEKAREVRDTSLKVPHGEYGKVIDVRVFSREESHELPPGVNQLVRVYVAQKRKISEGDKLAGRHGNKGVISKILPVEDMPYLADGTPVDIILNPLGVPSRMNVGQVLESHLGYAARHGWEGVDGQRGGGDERQGRRRGAQDAPAHRAGRLGLHAGLRRRPLGRGRGRRGAPDDQAGLRDAERRLGQRRRADPHRRQGHALQRPHRRGLRQPDLGRLRLHPEAGPPGGRQDPRPLDRPVLHDHPAAAGREGAVRWPALRRDGGVGPRGLRRRLRAAGAADHQVRRRARPGQGLRGHRQGREHPRAGHPRELQGAHQGDAVALPRRRGPGRRRP